MSGTDVMIEAAGGNGSPRELEARIGTPVGPRAGAAVVAPPHPLYGGSIHNHVVAALEAALGEQGFVTLAFNWRGVGRSSGAPSGDVADAVEDYLVAADWLSREHGAATIAAGYSFGAVAAVGAVSSGLAAAGLQLVALPPSFLGAYDITRLDAWIRVVTGADDPIAPPQELAGLLDAVPRAELHVIDGADHFFNGPSLAELASALSSGSLPKPT